MYRVLLERAAEKDLRPDGALAISSTKPLMKLLPALKSAVSLVGPIVALLCAVDLAILVTHGQQTNTSAQNYFPALIAKAEKGDVESQFLLGFGYYYGTGVEKDYTKAVPWFQKAAEQNHLDAQFLLGYCHSNGEGVKKDDTEAVKWFRKAAEQNHATAQANLGVAYFNGRGVEKDYTDAAKWFRKAAEQNHAEAQSRLGLLYYLGQGVEKDYIAAVRWYRKAVEQNHAMAHWLLGMCYAAGHGVEKDYTEAYAWYNLAAKTVEDAAKSRDDLEKKMSPQQVGDAQKRTKELRAQIETKLKPTGR